MNILYVSIFWHCILHARVWVSIGIFLTTSCAFVHTCISTLARPLIHHQSMHPYLSRLCVRAEDCSDYNECTLMHLSHCVCVPICMNMCVGEFRTGNVKVEVVPWKQRRLHIPASPHDSFPFIGARGSCPHHCNA